MYPKSRFHMLASDRTFVSLTQCALVVSCAPKVCHGDCSARRSTRLLLVPSLFSSFRFDGSGTEL